MYGPVHTSKRMTRKFYSSHPDTGLFINPEQQPQSGGLTGRSSILSMDHAMPLFISIVKEIDYPILHLVCKKNVVSNSFKKFMDNLEEILSCAATLKIEALHVNIDPRAFARWLKGKKASQADLYRYAKIIKIKEMALRGESVYLHMDRTKPPAPKVAFGNEQNVIAG